MAPVICDGCDRPFKNLRGFNSHLRQTKDSLCQEVGHALKAKNQSCQIEDEQPVSEPDWDADMAPIPFQGNVLGSAEDYEMDDFGQIDCPVEPPTDDDTLSDGLDEEAEMVAELESGWEPVRPEPIVEGDSDTEEEDSESVQAVLEQHQVQRTAESILMGEGHGVTPKASVKYSDKYPDALAGQPLSQQESFDTKYRRAVGGKDWAPFHSQMDWEIARWAKLRGPGSNAFSELLGIEGVSHEFLNRQPVLTIMCRSPRN